MAMVLLCALSVSLVAATDPMAARLAREARKAQDRGEVVRAYMLFSEAAERDPKNPNYAVQRNAMKPLADLMSKADLALAASGALPSVAEDDKLAAEDTAPVPEISKLELEADEQLLPPPAIEVSGDLHGFDLRADSKSLLSQVARAWGIDVVFDHDFVTKPDIRFQLEQADFRSAMSAVTAATGTFLFPITPRRIFVASDTQLKRTEFEPQVAMAVPLPNVWDAKGLTEAVNAVKQIVGNQGNAIAVDSGNGRVIIRDHVTRARAARALLEALLLPPAQVSFEVQLLSVDSDITYQYGISWQTTSQVIPLGLFALLSQVTIPSVASGTQFAAFGGGATLFGLSLTEASLFANYNKSNSRVMYDANVVVADGQTASLHVGDRYPIAQTLYTGSALTSGASLYNPLGQVTQQDLGLKLKLEPHVHSDGRVGLNLEANYQSLGTQTVDTVPSINERGLKGSVTLTEDQWAIIGGLEEDDHSLSHSGFPLLSGIPVLGTAFTQTTREHRKINVLVVIKPTITRLPMSTGISPQFLLGPEHGERVLL